MMQSLTLLSELYIYLVSEVFLNLYISVTRAINIIACVD